MVEISAWESDNQQQSGNNNQHPSSPSSQDHHSTTETPWTDAQVRWSKEEGVPEKEEEEPDFFDPFADPDPTQVFTFVFVVPNQPPQLDANSKMNELAADDENKLDSSSALSSKIELKIQGYKTHSDQVWQSTGLTLWKASKYLCDYMVAHAPELQNKRILELGAGLGLNGVLAHRIAPQNSSVVVTDGDTDALVQLRKNIQNNQVSDNISAKQLLWGQDTARTFAETCHNAKNDGRFDVILASDIIYAKVVIDPLWETIQALLSRPNGSFWMAFAQRNVPVTIDFVLQRAKECGFRYRLVAESATDDDDNYGDVTEEDTKNSKIEDAAGADQVFVYVFEWDTEPKPEVCRNKHTCTTSPSPKSPTSAPSTSSAPADRIKNRERSPQSSGFQRVFLLKKNNPIRGKTENDSVTRKNYNPSKPSSATEIGASDQEAQARINKPKPVASGWAKGFLTSKQKTPNQRTQPSKVPNDTVKDLLQIEEAMSDSTDDPGSSSNKTQTGLVENDSLSSNSSQPFLQIVDAKAASAHASEVNGAVGDGNNKEANTTLQNIKLLDDGGEPKGDEKDGSLLWKEVSTTRRIPNLEPGLNKSEPSIDAKLKSETLDTSSNIKGGHAASTTRSEMAKAGNARSILKFQCDLESILRSSGKFTRSEETMWTEQEANIAWEIVLTRPEGDNGTALMGRNLLKSHPNVLAKMLGTTESEDDRKMCLRAAQFLKGAFHDEMDAVSLDGGFQDILSPLVRLALSERRTLLSQTAWEASTACVVGALQFVASKENFGTESRGLSLISMLRDAQSLLQQQLNWQLSKRKPKTEKIETLRKMLKNIQFQVMSQNIEGKALQEIVEEMSSLVVEKVG